MREVNNVKQRNKFLKILIASSVLMFVSLFFGSKLASIGLLQYLIAVAVCFYKITKFTPSKFYEANDKITTEAFKDKKYFKGGFYFIITPMVAIGLMVLVMSIVVMFFYM